MYGTQDNDKVIKSIGFITFEEEKCDAAIREREGVVEAEVIVNAGTMEEGDVAQTEGTQEEEDHIVNGADDGENVDAIVE